MRSVALALALALALAALAPSVASAYPNHAYPCDVHGYDGVCFGDVEYGESCGSPGTYDGVTGVAVKFDGRYFLDAGGFMLCDTSETGERRAHGVYVETATVTLTWAEESCEGETYCDVEGCSYWLWVGSFNRRLDCVDGSPPPPNPGWGSLLP